jgi:thiamine biosynthesis protein ThiS
MQIYVNEEPREIETGATVAWLINRLELEPRFLAVERNRELVPRREHSGCVLAEGDRLEIVTLVGGG